MLYCHEYCKAVLCIVMSKRIVYIVEVRLKFEVIVSFCVKRETEVFGLKMSPLPRRPRAPWAVCLRRCA